MEKSPYFTIFSILCPMVVTGGMMIGGATWYLANDIAAGREDAAKTNGIVVARIAADEERINALEKLITARYNDEVAFRQDMRTSLSSMVNGLADLRVELVKSHK